MIFNAVKAALRVQLFTYVSGLGDVDFQPKKAKNYQHLGNRSPDLPEPSRTLPVPGPPGPRTPGSRGPRVPRVPGPPDPRTPGFPDPRVPRVPRGPPGDPLKVDGLER